MVNINKSKLLWTMMLTFLLLLSACGGTYQAEPNPAGQNTPNTPEDPDSQSGVDVKEQENLTLTFYYVDEELLTIKEKEKTISYFSEEEKWSALWQELQDAVEEGYVSLWEDVELIGMEVEGNQLNVNIAKPDNLQFGSATEGFAIQTLLQTVAQIEGIELVQLLIDGEIQETLAGHVSIDEPIPTDSMIYVGQ